MSQYEDYEQTCANYDRTRDAVGFEIIHGILASRPRNIRELAVLDAGCGTGNYSVRLAGLVGELVGVDLSLGMLRFARRKLLGARSRLIQCDLAQLPFAADCFDAVICKQVIHHLDEPGNGFANQRSFFAHVARVLKDDGVFIINTITHEQLRNGVWWGELIAAAVERMIPRFCTLEQLEQQLGACGFGAMRRIVPVDVIIQKHGYFAHDSLHRKEFRDGDSHFSLLTEQELASSLARLDEMIAGGELDRYIRQRDRLRQNIGQFTFLVATKENRRPPA